MAKPSQKKIIEAIKTIISVRTWEERRQLVEAQRNILLTEAADRVLLALLRENKDNEMTVPLPTNCATRLLKS